MFTLWFKFYIFTASFGTRTNYTLWSFQTKGKYTDSGLAIGFQLDCFLAVCPQKFYDSAELFSHAYNCHGLLPDSSVLIGTKISVENRDSNKIMSDLNVHRWNESVDGQLTLENMLKKTQIRGLQLHKVQVHSWDQFSGTYARRR
ncbi:unnamed protein product [Schistosoma rodhaini]|uniref:C2H2-type domain-containing protein n=1 Tax=Schistosoma rodhaini TaxID=6188 RepID=A0AA85F2Z9_9TREM|nr:unnamed protein product [Schistosoma rodhaini]